MNVQVPLHLLAAASIVFPTGTPGLQLGVAGPVRHSTPCFVSEGLLKVTAPPGVTLACIGDQ